VLLPFHGKLIFPPLCLILIGWVLALVRDFLLREIFDDGWFDKVRGVWGIAFFVGIFGIAILITLAGFLISPIGKIGTTMIVLLGWWIATLGSDLALVILKPVCSQYVEAGSIVVSLVQVVVGVIGPLALRDIGRNAAARRIALAIYWDLILFRVVPCRGITRVLSMAAVASGLFAVAVVLDDEVWLAVVDFIVFLALPFAFEVNRLLETVSRESRTE
jgi:hypothetical protein